MLIRKRDDLKWSDVTPESLYLRRREFLASAAVPVLAGAATLVTRDAAGAQGSGQKLTAKKSPLSATEEQTPFKDVTTYNNFYEFGTDKDDPAPNAKQLQAARRGRSRSTARSRSPATYDVDDLHQAASARGAHLSPALRRGLVDGDPLDRASRSAI